MSDDVSFTLWLTGLSGAGKTTLAHAVADRLNGAGRRCVVLDGDVLRTGLNRDLGFDPRDRSENIRRTAEVARLMNDAGLVVVAALISPWRVDRATARDIIGPQRFREVHVCTPLAVCEAADVKGLYARARRGELAQFTGVGAAYEVPEAPHLTIEPMRSGLPASVQALMDLMKDAAP